MEIHPQVIEKNGKKEFIVLPYNEFVGIQEELDDYEDLKDLREAKKAAKGKESIPLQEIKAKYNLK